jgi:AraC-like DNA-binding protein
MVLDRLLSNLEVHVKPFALCLVSSGWRLHLPGPPTAMLHFVLMGEGAVRSGEGRSQPLGRGWLVVVPKGAAHALESDSEIHNEQRIDAPPEDAPVPRLVAGSADDPRLIVACGTLHVRFGESLGLFDHLTEVLAVDLSDSPEVYTAFQGILAEQILPSSGGEAMKAALMSQCLVHLFRRLCENRDCRLPWLVALEDSRLAKAIDRILEDPAVHHTVASLAASASMSRSSFAERFTSAFGCSPISLVHLVRMQRAAHLLEQDKVLSIEEVAERVGFSSRSHFARAFKEHCGASPTAYRAAH